MNRAGADGARPATTLANRLLRVLFIAVPVSYLFCGPGADVSLILFMIGLLACFIALPVGLLSLSMLVTEWRERARYPARPRATMAFHLMLSTAVMPILGVMLNVTLPSALAFPGADVILGALIYVPVAIAVGAGLAALAFAILDRRPAIRD